MDESTACCVDCNCRGECLQAAKSPAPTGALKSPAPEAAASTPAAPPHRGSLTEGKLAPEDEETYWNTVCVRGRGGGGGALLL
jgi:hypothetical protein